MININDFTSDFLNALSHEPTKGQSQLVKSLSEHVCENEKNKLFIIKGYAGTGKTTLVKALTITLAKHKINSVLLAPTGRAAKVLAEYSNKHAFTIHKTIYTLKSSKDGRVIPILQKNLHENTFFIIDEASMIYDVANGGESDPFGNVRLLEDLFQYVNSGTNCRIIFIGDTAQLPPVGSDESPALDPEYLTACYSIQTRTAILTEVVRQSSNSGILSNATSIRKQIDNQNISLPFFHIANYQDIIKLNGQDLEDLLLQLYSDKNPESNLVICRSNKRANIFNREIRQRILFYESEVSAGDLLMCVRNNYFWLPNSSKAGFIANGDIIEIQKVIKYEELYGFRFADVVARLIDYPEENEIEVKILLDTLTIDTANLSWQDSSRLFREIMADYEDIPKKYFRLLKTRNSPHLNAVQVKYAYALTCHKSQGGQWDNVILDHGYFTEDMICTEYLRWLYTAISRATKSLYLLNYPEKFFSI